MREDGRQAEWVKREASRCLFCYEAPCREACPSRVDVPQFIRMIRSGNVKGAKRIIKRDNCLGGICAHVCPAAELCEKHCTFAKLGDPIPIARLQQFACENAECVDIGIPGKRLNKRIAVVGAGPAGLSCAHELLMLGYDVELFEKEPFLGGTVTREIPGFKVPREVIDQDLRELCLEGLTVHSETPVSRESMEKDLSARFDAVFLGVGLAETRCSPISGGNLGGQHDAERFLKMVKEGRLEKISGICFTIGGGNTAMDCARTAIRLGAERSIVSYRRSRKEMPADEAEYLKAVKEGVEFLWQTVPAFLNGEREIASIILTRTEPLAECGEERTRYAAVPGADFTYPARQVIWALGKDRSRMFEEIVQTCPGPVNRETLRVGRSNLFAGGDCVTQRQTVVEAVAQGKRAARSIHAYLSAS